MREFDNAPASSMSGSDSSPGEFCAALLKIISDKTMKINHRSSVLCVLFCWTTLFPLVTPAQDSKPPARNIVATIAGRALYEDELLPLMDDQLQQLRNQEYELRSRALDKLIDQSLLDAAAARKSITRDQLLLEEVTSKVPDPTDAEIEAYYLGQHEYRPLEELKPKLRESLKNARTEQVRAALMARLRREASVSVLLTPPKTEVGYDATRVRGNPNAPVTIVEFSDFQCPYCRASEQTVKNLLAKYGDKLKVAYRDFPLRSAHPYAEAAAEASRCASEQGKYWQYHDLLFSNPGKLDAVGLLEEARSLQLNEPQFQSCLNSAKFKDAVDADLKAGSRARVSATPVFFVNGIFIAGAQPASAFEKAIDSELARLGSSSAPASPSAAVSTTASRIPTWSLNK